MGTSPQSPDSTGTGVPEGGHRIRALLRALFCAAGLGAASASAASAEGHPGHWIEVPPALRAEPLLVRLHDPYRLLPRRTRERLQEEVVLAFERSGVVVQFVGGGGPSIVAATLYPEFPEPWDIPSRAIGVAIGGEARRPVFLSLGAAERALGFRHNRRATWKNKRHKPRRLAPGRKSGRLGIALGRVLAHEIIHSIAPDCPHTATGLMAERLSRRTLTAPGVKFDALATRHLRRSAASLGLGAP